MEKAAIHILGIHPNLDGLSVVQPRDNLAFDPAPLARLFADKGPHQAEEIICRAVEDLARKLQRVEENHRACTFARLGESAAGMIAVADQIGLSAVSQVAKDVRDCALSDDAVALGSTVARLTRVTDRSLTEIWDVSVMP